MLVIFLVYSARRPCLGGHETYSCIVLLYISTSENDTSGYSCCSDRWGGSTLTLLDSRTAAVLLQPADRQTAQPLVHTVIVWVLGTRAPLALLPCIFAFIRLFNCGTSICKHTWIFFLSGLGWHLPWPLRSSCLSTASVYYLRDRSSFSAFSTFFVLRPFLIFFVSLFSHFCCSVFVYSSEASF